MREREREDVDMSKKEASSKHLINLKRKLLPRDSLLFLRYIYKNATTQVNISLFVIDFDRLAADVCFYHISHREN